MPIHATAFVDPTAVLDSSVEVGPYCRVGPHCVLGEGNVLMQGAILGPRTVAGKGNVFHYNSIVGHDPQFLGFDPETKSGTVIGDGNHFREFSTVHRGLKDGTNTVLGNQNYIMTTAHLAHDCTLGNNNVLVSFAGISGHVTMEDRCFISGHVAIHQFCRVGTLAMIGGRSGIPRDVPPYMMTKHYGEVVGLNVVGLRRAGVGAPTRMALMRCYKTLFRSGLALSTAVAAMREEFGADAAPEVAHLLDFCSVKSKRGMSRGPRKGTTAANEDDD